MGLRTSMIAKIWAAIEKSPFTATDFVVEFAESPLVTISFRYKPEYLVSISENFNGQVTAQISPGAHLSFESTVLQSMSDIPEIVLGWSRNVRDELRSTVPVYSELDRLRELLDAHVNEHLETPESTFSTEEAEDIKSKLDSLTERFEEMQQKSELTAKEVDRLTKEISSLKENLAAYPKGVWYKTAATRLWSTFSKIATSNESQKLLAKAAGKALGIENLDS